MSVSGGSGGMSVETVSVASESLVYRFLELNKETREILKSSRSCWDATTGAGARDGSGQLASLSSLCKDFVTSNIDQISKKVQISIVFFTISQKTQKIFFVETEFDRCVLFLL